MHYSLLLVSLQSASTPERTFLEYGLLGAIVVVLAYALVKLFKIVLNDRDKAIQQRDELLEITYTKVLPAITENTRLFAELTEILKENNRVLSRHDSQGGR